MLTTPTGAGRPSRRLLVLLGTLSTIAPLSIDLYLPSLNSLAEDLSSSASATQLTISANLVGLAVGQLMAGPISDSLGRRRPLLVGVGLFVLTSLLCALAPSMGWLVGARVLQGMAGAAGLTIAMAMVRDMVSGAEAARTFAMLVLVTGLGPLLAPFIGGQLLAFTDWRGVFVVLTGMGLALFLVSFVALPETLPPERRHQGGAGHTGRVLAGLARDRWFVALVICIGLAFATLMVYVAGAVFLLENQHGLSPQTIGIVFAVNALMMIGVSQISARVVMRTGAARLLALGLAIGTVASGGLLVAVLADLGLAAILVSIFVLIASRGLVYPNAQALALEDHPEAAGTAAGLIGVLRFGTGAAFAPLAGLGGADDATPMVIIIFATSVAAVAVLLVGLRLRRTTPRVAA